MIASRLLTVENLGVTFLAAGPEVRAVRGISFCLDRGEALALVGESGCGKTVTALALLGLLPGYARISGRILWQGRDLNRLSEAERAATRGRSLAMVFQEPSTSLNPVYTVGEQIAEALRYHFGLSRREADARTVALLTEVQVPDAAAKARSFPHQLSGGMQQRIMLAMALACNPELLVADEPTTALDVTVQAQIISLLAQLRQRRRVALLFITHDLALVPALADRIAVMYAGSLVETGPIREVLTKPAHPYTRVLLLAQPELWSERGPLPQLPGLPPDPQRVLVGCPFAPRCAYVQPACRQSFPDYVQLGQHRRVACLAEVAGDLAVREVPS